MAKISDATYWNIVLIHNVTWTGQSYVGTIEIPYFLPSDIRISVTGTVNNIFNPDGIRSCGYIHDLRTYIDNAPPTVEISSPKNGEMTDRMIVVEGIASDDVSVETVLIRIDGEEWVKANGTETWRYDIGTEGLSEGPHIIEAISFDGSKYSGIEKIEIEFAHIQPHAIEPWPFIIILILIIGTICSIYLLRRGKDKSTV